MAHRHYGLDVSVMEVGSTDVKAVYESCDFKDTTIKKESTAAQDTGPNKRAVGSDWTFTLNKFIEGASDWLWEYCDTNRNNINLRFIMTAAGSGNAGSVFKTFTMTGAIVSDMSLNLGGEASKESITFERGAGGDYAVT